MTITGYRTLTIDEIDVINRVKVYEQLGLELIALIRKQHEAQWNKAILLSDDADEEQRLGLAEPERWASLGRTHLQEATMCLVRSIAQPGG